MLLYIAQWLRADLCLKPAGALTSNSARVGASTWLRLRVFILVALLGRSDPET